MLRTVPFQAAHLDRLAEQAHSAYLRAYVRPDELRALEGPLSWSVIDEADGSTVACAGLIPRWPHSAQAWAYLGAGRPQQFLFFHKRVLQFLNVCPFARIEAFVRTDFDKGHRWAQLLGFALEAPRMKFYGPDRMDYSLYARVQHERMH